MKYWILKGRPDGNDWEEMLVPGNQNVWHTGQPPKSWSPGDRMFCWESSPALRMVGLAELVNPNAGSKDGHRLFEVRYVTRPLAYRPTIDELRRVPVVNQASFLKSGPATTVLPLSDLQSGLLMDFLRSRNPELALIWPDITLVESTADFEPGLSLLDAHDYYPEFSGTRTRFPDISEATWEHGKVMDSLNCELESLKRKRSWVAKKNKNVDMFLIDQTGRPTVILEGKTDVGPYNIYTALGQLLYHSHRFPDIQRVLVAPELPDLVVNRLAKLGIKVVAYERVGETIRFTGFEQIGANK
jgi:hypothetical protein